MHISKIKIENYKGFNNHETIELKKGINLLIGKNNSGKTALLEALTFNVSKQHLSIENKPRDTAKVVASSIITGELIISKEYFFNYIEDSIPNQEFIVPISFIENRILTNEFEKFQSIKSPEGKLLSYTWDNPSRSFYINQLREDDSLNNFSEFDFNEIFVTAYSLPVEKNEIDNEINLSINQDIYIKVRENKQFSINEDYDIDIPEQFRYVKLKLEGNKLLFITRKIDNNLVTISQIFENLFNRKIFKFDVFRKFYAASSIYDETKLNPNCDNLVSVLHKFKNSDPIAFGKYKKALKNILGIEELIFETIKSTVEIKIWNTEPIGGRPDLAISLDDCGTGVGQVLAILYVVISAREPKVILIDEPNSFLHPSASRKLMEVLTEYPQHQYFITTHSPELISNFGDNILHTQLIDGEIKVRQINKKDKNEIESIFSDLGIRLSDVYGFDSVFWVEGETEEKCLPLILRKHGIDISNTAFLSVKNTGGTGKFDKDYINNTVKIYNKLSLIENTYTPSAIGFFFDKEGKNIEDIKSKLGKTDKEKVIFTDKKLYENYLLNIDAIWQLLENEKQALIEIDQANEKLPTFSREDVEKWIEENKFLKVYWENREPTESQKNNWKNEVHAAQLLEGLFLEVFKTVNPYKKTRHSELLTKIILELEPNIFLEFVNKIKPLIEKIL